MPEAELVVSAGRGLKGPENWGMIEELAGVLGATTACSRPVADMHWRPHHEHVGQTGLAIRPNLYIAVGISGAIQHLAGVNSSKCIVVINRDAEAPFFKAAHYGIVGDAFELLHHEGGQVFNLSIHPWLMGMAHRIKYLDEALRRVERFGNVWQATPGEVARHYRETMMG